MTKANVFKGKYEAKLEFLEGWSGGFKPNQNNPCMGKVFFWNHTFLLSGFVYSVSLQFTFLCCKLAEHSKL